MNKYLYLCVLLLTLFILCGCAGKSPYDYGDNWLIRGNDIPQFHSTFDLFYISHVPDAYGKTHDIQFNWAKTHTNDIFGTRIRVFAPKIPNLTVENTAEALQFYLDHFHQEGHPFILLAEGKAADLLYAAMQKVSGLSTGNGFIAAYLPDMAPKTPEEITDTFSWDDLKPASGARDYGVIVTWQSCINGQKTTSFKGAYNINPLNWKTDGTPGTKKENLLSVFYRPASLNKFWRKETAKNLCGAVIDLEKGILSINCPAGLLHADRGKFLLNNISLFAENLARNARERTGALIKDRQWRNRK